MYNVMQVFKNLDLLLKYEIQIKRVWLFIFYHTL